MALDYTLVAAALLIPLVGVLALANNLIFAYFQHIALMTLLPIP